MPSERMVSTRERLEELCRETGTLLLAFTPLDVALASKGANQWPKLLLFLLLGASLFTAAVIAERRRQHVD